MITLIVHLCTLEHDARDVARRAGPSATVDSCRVVGRTERAGVDDLS